MEINTEENLPLTEKNFHTQVLQSDQPVLVDFWAPWCGPCRTMSPVIADLALEWKGKITIGKVNVDEQPQLAAEYRIQSIPTFLLFQNGQVAETLVGAVSRKVLVEKFQVTSNPGTILNEETPS